MGAEITRVVSDVHYGDRATRVRSLAQLSPLFDGASAFILNGDTLDTRPGPPPEHAREEMRKVREFFARAPCPVTFLSGNHDADFTTLHSLDLAKGRVFATHGDILFDDIVPWGRDAKSIRVQLKAALAAISIGRDPGMDERLLALRAVAASIPQRHQSERRPLQYALRFAADTVWPPHRAVFVLRAWREMPARAAAFLRRYRPDARFILIGHTHRPGVWRTRSGVVVINTGTFCPPFSPYAVDISPDRLTVRRIEARSGEFHFSTNVAKFTLP